MNQDQERSSSISITVKWNKQTYSFVVENGSLGLSLKEQIQKQTGVPISRQKVLCSNKKGHGMGSGWKGPLSDDFIFTLPQKSTSLSLMVTLIGSAETMQQPQVQTTFVEDLTPEQIQQAQQEQLNAAMATAKGMIHALQLPPQDRDDGKKEVYAYNRLVQGLPQRQMEDILSTKQSSNNPHLLGTVVMTMGLELRRAYVNDLAVLADGTLVSVLDDGHVQLWKHGSMQYDVIHDGGLGNNNSNGGVDSVVAIMSQKEVGNPTIHTEVSFATTGRGCLRLWNSEAESVASFNTIFPGTSPTSVVQIRMNDHPISNNNTDNNNIYTVCCLAVRFQITREENPNQFRLPPQNEQERMLRRQAETREAWIQQNLLQASKSVQVWYITTTAITNTSPTGGWKSKLLVAPNTTTCLQSFTNSQYSLVMAGDDRGTLNVWKIEQQGNDGLFFQEYCQVRFMIPTSSSSPSSSQQEGVCSIACLQTLGDGRLAVSTEPATTSRRQNDHDYDHDDASFPPRVQQHLAIPVARGVHILTMSNQGMFSIQVTLNGHVDTVRCMCELPTGDLLTGGGKLDATLQLWTKDQQQQQQQQPQDKEVTDVMEMEEETTAMTTTTAAVPIQTQAYKRYEGEIGYVFALTVLPDAHPTAKNANETPLFAVAAARYNTIKIIL